MPEIELSIFHDIMNGVENHAEEGAKKTREVFFEEG